MKKKISTHRSLLQFIDASSISNVYSWIFTILYDSQVVEPGTVISNTRLLLIVSDNCKVILSEDFCNEIICKKNPSIISPCIWNKKSKCLRL